jgi:tungstate transport system substrate-binding protein
MTERNEMEQEHQVRRVSRRVALTTGSVLALGLASAKILGEPALAADDSRTNTVYDPSLIRLASVSTIQEGGLLRTLLPPFKAQTGRRVQVYVGEDVYARARAGRADLVISHFGHKDTQAFITQGLGQWPRTVLFNSIALIIPTRDPAHVAHLGDPVEAFRRIAATRSPFIVNNVQELRYLVDILWDVAGRPHKAGWYLDTGARKDAAMRAAAKHGGYSLWGVTPFLVSQQKAHRPLRPVLYGEEMFHRMMVSVVVNPTKFPHANVTGALAFQQYLLEPATQARIRTFRYPGIAQPLFWPGGRNNAPYLLPKGDRPASHHVL